MDERTMQSVHGTVITMIFGLEWEQERPKQNTIFVVVVVFVSVSVSVLFAVLLVVFWSVGCPVKRKRYDAFVRLRLNEWVGVLPLILLPPLPPGYRYNNIVARRGD